MLAGMARTLVVKVTAGADAPERCAQAFTVAATAVAAGVSVSLWLTGESAWFALPGRAAEFSLPHSAPLPDLLDAVLAGGTVTRVHAVRGPARHHRRRRAAGRPDRRRGGVRRGVARRRRPGPRLLTLRPPPSRSVTASARSPIAWRCRTDHDLQHDGDGAVGVDQPAGLVHQHGRAGRRGHRVAQPGRHRAGATLDGRRVRRPRRPGTGSRGAGPRRDRPALMPSPASDPIGDLIHRTLIRSSAPAARARATAAGSRWPRTSRTTPGVTTVPRTPTNSPASARRRVRPSVRAGAQARPVRGRQAGPRAGSSSAGAGRRRCAR